jgi:hypothetical protein
VRCGGGGKNGTTDQRRRRLDKIGVTGEGDWAHTGVTGEAQGRLRLPVGLGCLNWSWSAFLVAGHGFGCTSTFNAGDLSLVPEWPPFGVTVMEVPSAAYPWFAEWTTRGPQTSLAVAFRGHTNNQTVQLHYSTVQDKTMESQLLSQKKRREGGGERRPSVH